jgi:hypothetical protein
MNQPQPDRTAFYVEDFKPEPLRRVVGFIAADLGLSWAVLEQIAIALLSLASIAMLASTSPALQKWGCLVGLVGQPLWIHCTWRARQWGMFAMSCCYTFVLAGGAVARFLT